MNLLVEGALGEMSMFDRTFGVYAHANPLEGLFKVPRSWVSRLKIEKEPNSGVKIVVPHPLDLVFSKMIGFREKDFVFCECVMEAFKLKIEDLKKLVDEYIRDNFQEKEIVLKAFDILQGRVRKIKGRLKFTESGIGFQKLQ